MKIVKKTTKVNGRELSLEVGRFAGQATSAVLARYGDTMVLATVTASPKVTSLDYFPLSIEYVERLYAGGRIKGSRWVKREGRPSDDAVLAGRVIDRSVRPLFPKSYKHDVQVVITVLSVDSESDPDILGLIATSAAIALSPIPWRGPVGAVRLGYVKGLEEDEGTWIINPSMVEQTTSEYDLVVSSTKEKVLMIEGGFCETSEDKVFEAIKAAKKVNNDIIDLINSLVKESGVPKIEMPEVSPAEELKHKIEKEYKKEVESVFVKQAAKETSSEEVEKLAGEIAVAYENKWSIKEVAEALDGLFKKKVKTDVLTKGKRVDGRKIDEIRPLTIEVGVLPRTHGSAVFQRGQTQALTVATLGAPSLEQLIESPTGEESKRYIHHYSMPPYSVGETGRMGTPSRREIGHGALAERALLAVIPAEDKFPYTIRLVSEILSSNGSTSMASTCGSTLALMDAGVPIKEPVAGISIGLMTDPDDAKKYVLLTDIMGIEDFSGDMDFKVAGTKNGITAIQLDVKLDGLTDKMIEETLELAKKARMKILAAMLKVIDAPRNKISKYAPKVTVIKIPVEKIGEIIGPGGKIIRNIISTTGAAVDVNDDGSVMISGTDELAVEKAVTWVTGLIREVQVGEEFEGEVKRILPFGAFVEILPGKEGMVHVSQMSAGFVSSPNDVVSIGQKVKVRVMEIDDQRRVNLSMLFGEDAKNTPPRERREREEYPRRKPFDRGRRRF